MRQNSKPRTSQDKAYLFIKNAIFSGRFGPGEHLKEKILADEADCGRTPVRYALRSLSEEGIVEIRDNNRCYVADISQEDTEQIFDILVMLEGYSAKLASENITDEQLEYLSGLHTKMKQLPDDEDSDRQFLELNSEFHKTVHRASGNQTLYEMIRRIVDIPQNIYLKFGRRTENEMAIMEHGLILEALRNRDSYFSEVQMRNHVDSVRREFRHIWSQGQ